MPGVLTGIRMAVLLVAGAAHVRQRRPRRLGPRRASWLPTGAGGAGRPRAESSDAIPPTHAARAAPGPDVTARGTRTGRLGGGAQTTSPRHNKALRQRRPQQPQEQQQQRRPRASTGVECAPKCNCCSATRCFHRVIGQPLSRGPRPPAGHRRHHHAVLGGHGDLEPGAWRVHRRPRSGQPLHRPRARYGAAGGPTALRRPVG